MIYDPIGVTTTPIYDPIGVTTTPIYDPIGVTTMPIYDPFTRNDAKPWKSDPFGDVEFDFSSTFNPIDEARQEATDRINREFREELRKELDKHYSTSEGHMSR